MDYEHFIKIYDALCTYRKNNPKVFATPSYLIHHKVVKNWDTAIVVCSLRSYKDETKETLMICSIIAEHYINDSFENVFGAKINLKSATSAVFCGKTYGNKKTIRTMAKILANHIFSLKIRIGEKDNWIQRYAT